MTAKLMPYGASRYVKLVAKVGNGDNPKRVNVENARLAPYGSSEHGNIVSKVGRPKIDSSAERSRRVLRLNKAGD